MIAKICKEEYEEGQPYTYHRMRMMECLDSLYDCIDAADFHHFSKEESHTFTENVQLFLAHYTKCSKMKYAQGDRYRYNTVSKHHCMAHMPAKALYLNPRCGTTYTGETMVGFICTVGHACLNGTPAHLISHNLCWRWRLSFDLRLDLADDE